MAAKAVVCYGSSTSSTTLRPVLCPQQLNKRSFFSSVFALLWPELCFLLLFIILLLHVGGGFLQWILGEVASISITKVWAFGTFKCVVSYWKLEIIYWDCLYQYVLFLKPKDVSEMEFGGYWNSNFSSSKSGAWASSSWTQISGRQVLILESSLVKFVPFYHFFSYIVFIYRTFIVLILIILQDSWWV